MSTIKRCAIYCRKSHEEGLEQEFNSLDAQREAIQAYILTQRFNGWTALPKTYEDGGYSGGTTERPALQELIRDIKNGQINIVLVYKIDRLSRSLIDFTNLFSLFEEKGVAFVSVTQQIDTSTPAGRMMLNILMTFAQYEREVIAERIRDKFDASRRKGMWMGGAVPPGYKVEEKKLVPNEEHANTVRWIFKRYAEVASIPHIIHEVNSKGWYHPSGRLWRHATISALLKNVVYIGKVSYKGNVYNGEHKAIIDLDVWEKVQALLKKSRQKPGTSPRASTAPLKGILRCGHCGCAMTPSYSIKESKRYCYYICHNKKKHLTEDCPIKRIASNEIESIVFEKLKDVLQSETFYGLLIEAGVREDVLKHTLQHLPELWNQLFPIERIRLIQLLFEKVTVYKGHVDIVVQTNGMKTLIEEMQHAQI